MQVVGERMKRRVFALAVSAVLTASLGATLLAESRPLHEGDEKQLLSLGRDLEVTGVHDGDVQLLGAQLTIDGEVRGDVVVLAGDLRLTSRARVDGDVILLGGLYNADEKAVVSGELYLPGQLPSLGRLTNEKSSLLGSMQHPFSLLAIALKVSLLFAWFVAALVVALTMGREIRSSSLELRGSPYHTLALGLVAFTSFVITAVVFSYLIPYFVGLFLLAVLAVFAMITKIYGLVVVFHTIGWRVVGPRRPEQVGARKYLRGDLAMVMLGLFILGAIRLIPFVGTIVWIVASLFGIGTALATKFGRRDPWFLALRPETVRND